MTTGQTSQNTRSMDLRRYGYFADDIFVVERTKNEFMRRNDTPVPVLSGRKVQRSWKLWPKHCRCPSSPLLAMLMSRAMIIHGVLGRVARAETGLRAV